MKCVVCGFNETTKLIMNKTILEKCPKCGIVCSLHSEADKLDEYYRNQYVIKEGDKIDSEIRRITAIPEQLFLLSVINKYKPTPAILLDFGCDKGFLLEEARHSGYKVIGIELSENSTNYCRMNGLTVFDDIKLINEKVDIVTMNHSLEHLLDPVEFLGTIRKYMDDDAIISIRVPDFGSVWSRILKSKWVWFQPQNHYFHYTIDSLSYLLENNGFDIIFINKRKPQNCITNKAKNLAIKSYKKYFDQGLTLKIKLSAYYSWLTGAEIFALARKKNESA